MRGDIHLHLLPGVLIMADALTVATNRQRTLQLPSLRERPTRRCVGDAPCLFPLFLRREIPHEHAAPLLPAAVGVDGGREGNRQPTAVLALHREDTLKAPSRTTLCHRLKDLRVREVHDRAAPEGLQLVEQVSEEQAGSRIGIEDRPVLRARQKDRIEPVLHKLGVDRFIWYGHNSSLRETVCSSQAPFTRGSAKRKSREVLCNAQTSPVMRRWSRCTMVRSWLRVSARAGSAWTGMVRLLDNRDRPQP